MIKNKKGFTLIELIIVMAIIGILSVVAIVAISGKSIDARNARRLADMSAVQTGLALHCVTPPSTGSDFTCGGTSTAGALAALSGCDSTSVITTLQFVSIKDPSGQTVCARGASEGPCDYAIQLTATNTANACEYFIYAALENETDAIVEVTEKGIRRLSVIPPAL